MNFFTMFEDRIASIFGTSPEGYQQPFSFKKLAKRVAKEMDNETYSIDGVNTAPALFTILISSADDAAMRPLYASLTKEVSQFVEAQAQNKGRTFVGKPVVRFMVDPSLRNGRFSVFAENVDARSLARLRAEELSFLGGMPQGAASQGARSGGASPASPSGREEPGLQTPAPARGASSAPAANHAAGRASASVRPEPRPDRAQGPRQAQVMTALDADSSLVSSDLGLDVIPASDTDGPYVLTVDAPGAPQSVALADATGFDAAPIPVPGEVAASLHVPMAAPQQQEIPATVRRTPAGAYAGAAQPAQANQAGRAPENSVSCLLIDRESGRTYCVNGLSTTIGRARSTGGIVLSDPNISRRHAELTYTSTGWRICDLNSTNGTLVNNVDIDECALRDGDLITLGLTNLEFREGL